MFTFSLITPDEEDYSFKAGLLVFDNEIKILADPSWNGKKVDEIIFMEQYLREVQLILLSHSTPEFISGYILLCLKFPNLMSSIPVYCTLPVNQLGRISTVEYYRANGILGPLQSSILELDEIDEWFDKVTPLKFLQSISLFDNKLGITPYCAGHTLGGTFWLITKRIDKIIYAPAWNHSRDSFLNSADFLPNGNPSTQLLRPTAIITSTDLGSTMPHKKRTEKFLQLVDATLANGGAALLPTSLSGRFLELFHLIDEHLQGAPIPVYFLSYSGTKILSYASTLLDWMSPSLLKEWEEATSEGSKHKIPFEPSKVDLLGDPNELVRLSGPKIVFCSGSDLRNGELSSQALQYLCQDEKTTILLTEKSQFGNDDTISSVLYREWYKLAKLKNNGVAEDGVAVPLEKLISIDDWTREEALVGVELTDYQEKIHNHRKQRMLAKVREKKNKNLLDSDTIDAEDSSEDEEPSSDEDEITTKTEKPADKADSAGGVHNKVVDELAAHEAFITDHIKQALDQNKPLDLRITHKLKPRQAMFPYIVNVHKQKFDDYGEIIDIKLFQKTEDTTNTQIIMEGKKKFEEREKRKGKNNKSNTQSKLTPQEQLNNQILEKYLDSLHQPKKRISMNSHGSSFKTSNQLRIRCGLSFVDLSGLVDIRSLSVIVSALKPYNLILLPDFTVNKNSEEELNGLLNAQAMFLKQQEDHKSEETKKNLYATNRYLSLSTIRSNSGIVSLYGASNKMSILPVVLNEPINVGGDSDRGELGISTFEVKLDDSIVEDLNWQNIDGSYRVAQVYGELEIQNPNLQLNEQVSEKRKITDYINSSTLFTLKKIKREKFIKENSKKPKNILDTTENTTKLAIGNIRLPELKKKLMSQDLRAEFKSEGTLVVNDTIAIRKVAYSTVEGDDTGDIIIDGNMGPLYYQVKDCIREMLAYV